MGIRVEEGHEIRVEVNTIVWKISWFKNNAQICSALIS